MRRDLRNIAAPFVFVVSAGCPKSTETISPPPATSPTTTDTTGAAPTTTASPSASTTGLIFDGYSACYRLVDGEKKYVPRCPESMLPLPPNDQLVYKRGDHDPCNRVPDGNPVQCPPDGPTAILPDPSSIVDAQGSVSLQFGTLMCLQHNDAKCPPGIKCNPPGPTVVTCPAALMPKLAPGVKPTKREGTRCWFSAVEVACPKP